MSAHVAVFLTLYANFLAPVTSLPVLSFPDSVPWSPCKNVIVTSSFPGFGVSGSAGFTLSSYVAVNVTGFLPTVPVLFSNLSCPSNQATNFFVLSVGVGSGFGSATAGVAPFASSHVAIFKTS